MGDMTDSKATTLYCLSSSFFNPLGLGHSSSTEKVATSSNGVSFCFFLRNHMQFMRGGEEQLASLVLVTP